MLRVSLIRCKEVSESPRSKGSKTLEGIEVNALLAVTTRVRLGRSKGHAFPTLQTIVQ